jgi:ubiquinone/menaquinone biosynthesis C-methylase UbiE
MMALAFDRDLSVKQDQVSRVPDMVAQRRRMHAVLDIRPGERVLEIGCGSGIMSYELAGAVTPRGTVTGADISPEMVKMATNLCAALPNVEFIKADAADLPFGGGSFDVVTATQCLCYVSDVEAALREMFRV